MVVLGSDGLFDNLWEDDLLALVQNRLDVSHLLAIALAFGAAAPLLLLLLASR